jgi:serine/threonine protein kinase
MNTRVSREPSASEREVLESETISSEQSPDEILSALTQSIDAHTATLSNAGQAAPSEVYNSGSPSDRSGQLIHDRYRLLRMLGQGGMGTVYLAQHTTLARTFAVKLLNPRYAARADIAERFLQEAKAVSRIEHDNVVGVTDFGTSEDGAAFLVMEHLRGESLAALCKREAPLPWPRVRHIMTQLCRALQAAHDVGVVHRDIKLENILRTERGSDADFIKVLDFGLAKLQTGGGLRLTRTGVVLGTPDYMSPEQARGAPTDHRTDIYAAGVVMYVLLCGRPPFRAKNFMGMRNQHLLVTPEPPSAHAREAGISEEMDAVVLRALAKDPRNRFESMAKMNAAIATVGTGVGPVVLLEAGETREDEDPPSFDAVGGLIERGSMLDRGGRVTRRRTHREQRVAPNVAPTPSERRRLPLFGVLFISGVASVAAALWPAADHDTEEPAPTPASPVVELEPNTPASIEHQPLEPSADTVVLRFATNVPVRVLEARDHAMFGRGALIDRIEVPRSDTTLQLILRAEGYRDREISVVPDRDRSIIVDLELAPAPAPIASKPNSKAQAPKTEPAHSEPAHSEPAHSEPPPKPTDNSFAPEIVDPWAATKQGWEQPD